MCFWFDQKLTFPGVISMLPNAKTAFISFSKSLGFINLTCINEIITNRPL